MNSRLKYILPALAGLMTFGLYLPALQNAFVDWDDNTYVVENPKIRTLGLPFFRWALTTLHGNNWHPLTWLSHALDYALWGMAPMGHHLTNIALHGVNTFLVAVLVMKLWGLCRERMNVDGRILWGERAPLVAGVVTALLFGMHPLHVESVVWVAERKDVLCGLFYLMSVLAYISFRSSEGNNKSYRSYKTYILSFAFFILAIMSKPMAVSLPLVLLLLDWYPLGRLETLQRLKAALTEKTPFVLFSLLASVLTLVAQKAVGPGIQPEDVPFGKRALVAMHSLLIYLKKLLLPYDLSPFYPYPKDSSILSPEYLTAALLVIAITVLCLLAAGRRRVFMAVWGYYLITLMPVIGIIRVGSQAMADRYMYLPSLGPLLLVGAGAAWGLERMQAAGGKRLLKGLTVASGSLAFIAMAYLTVVQIKVWRNTEGLWSFVIEKFPEGGPLPYNNRGEYYCKALRWDLALRDFDRSIAIAPSDPTSYNNRGIVYDNLGQPFPAMADYNKAIALAPEYAMPYYNRGVLYSRMGFFNEALENFNAAISLNPEDAKAHNNRGILLDSLGQSLPALADFGRAIEIDPEHASSYFNRGKAYLKAGSRELARSDFQEACKKGSMAACDEVRPDTDSGSGGRPR